MLKVKSFKVSDDTGINELLTNYRIAEGAHILISNGEICIPYEDGEPINKAHRIIAIREEQNKMRRQKEIVLHSQKVLTRLIEDAKERVNTAEADVAEAEGKNKKRKDRTKELLKHAQGNLDHLEDQYRQNDQEVKRFDLNLSLFDEAVAEITKE